MIIYTLTDPISKKVRYVGLTTKSLKERFAQHYSRKCNNHKCNWIKSLRKQNLKPIIEVLDIANSIEELNSLEIYWIEQLKQWGFDLLNLTNGGEGSFGYKHTKDTILKIKKIWNLRPKKPPVKKITKSEQYLLVSKILSKKVIEYSLNGDFIKIWNSRKEAAKFYGIRQSAIGNALKDESRSCNGSLWRNFTENFSKKISKYTYTGNKRRVMVHDVHLNKEFTFMSAKDAFVLTGKPLSLNLFINKNKLFKNRYIFKEC